MKKLSRSSLEDLFQAISAQRKLYIPAEDGAGQAKFAPWTEGMALSNALNTVRSAKDLFFPQVEALTGFVVNGKTIEIVDDRTQAEPFAIFGVRACDCRSFDILDSVFLADPVDSFYAARRESGLVITLACGRPAETCFCTAFGIDAADPAGDVTCWLTEDALYWRANTEKGRALTDALPMLADCGDEAVAEQQAKTREILGRLPLKDLDLTGFGRDGLLDLFHSDKWETLAQSCLGCGTCTFVCPTCQCYDVQDFQSGSRVRRFRCWDSCMYSDFTMMAHGTNRPTQKERFRQRFMHKLVYHPSNHEGTFGCVGCGRCLQKCPIHMNIVKVVNALEEDAK